MWSEPYMTVVGGRPAARSIEPSMSSPIGSCSQTRWWARSVGEGVMNVDELRRGIESMPRDAYERASYYQRWLYSLETILTEKGILAPGELDQRVAG
jgi:hypothetical protein